MAAPSPSVDAGHCVWCRRIGGILATGVLLVLVAGRAATLTGHGMLVTSGRSGSNLGAGKPNNTPPAAAAPDFFHQGNDMSRPIPEKQTDYGAHAELRKHCVWTPPVPAHQLLPPGVIEARSPSIGMDCPTNQTARNLFVCKRDIAISGFMCPGGPTVEFESDQVAGSKCVVEGTTRDGTPTTTVFFRLGPYDLAVNTSVLFAMSNPFGGHMAPAPPGPGPARDGGSGGGGGANRGLGDEADLLWWIAAMVAATDPAGNPYGLPPVHIHHSTRWHLAASGVKIPYRDWAAFHAGMTIFPGGVGDKQCLPQDGGVECLYMAFPQGYAQPPLAGNLQAGGDVIESWFENLGAVDLNSIYFEYSMTGRRQTESQYDAGMDSTSSGGGDARRLKAALQFTFIINGNDDPLERYLVVADAPPKLQYRTFKMMGAGHVVASDVHAHARGLVQLWLIMGSATDVGLPRAPHDSYSHSVPVSSLAGDGRVATAMEVVAAAAAAARVPVLCNWTASTELIDGRVWDRAAVRDGARKSRWVQPERCTGFRFAAGTVITLLAFHHLDTTQPGYGGVGDVLTHTVWHPMIHLDGLESYDASEGWGWGRHPLRQ